MVDLWPSVGELLCHINEPTSRYAVECVSQHRVYAVKMVIAGWAAQSLIKPIIKLSRARTSVMPRAANKESLWLMLVSRLLLHETRVMESLEYGRALCTHKTLSLSQECFSTGFFLCPFYLARSSFVLGTLRYRRHLFVMPLPSLFPLLR